MNEQSRGSPAASTNPPASAERVRVAVERIARACSATAALVGGAYFVLWLAGVPRRWSAHGAITMKANMALAQVLAGSALLSLQGNPDRRRRIAGAVLAATVLVIGALTLLEHLAGADLGIDQLFAAEPPGAPATARPNRMGPLGATALLLLGAGTLALPWRRRVALFCGIAACSIVLVPAVGFLYQIGELYSDPDVTAIAWPAVIALSFLGAALMLTGRGEAETPLPWRHDPGGVLLRRMVPPAVLVTLALGFLRVEGERRGLFSRSAGTGLFAVSLIVVLVLLLWRSADRLSAAATERRTLEQQATWRASLLDLAQDAIIVWTPSGGVESWNRGAEELYGYSPHEVIGQLPHSVLGTAYPRPWTEIAAELDRTGRWAGQLLHRSKGGSELVVSAKLQVVGGTDGAARILESDRDVTEAKRAGDRLRDADRRKDEFLAMLSHELRNPLAPISSSLFVLERSSTDERVRRATQVALRQVRHLTRLVDDLLDVTRIARGKIRLQRTALDLGALIRRTGEDHRGIMAERGIDLSIDVQAEPVIVNGDETRLAQVLGNLLSNAVKFTPAGGRVGVAVTADPSDAKVVVTDTGPGVDPSLGEALFEPFAQGKQTLARTDGGLGLGLALVKSLVALHGGEVTVQGAGPSGGASFVVRLPRWHGTESPSAGASPRGSSSRTRVLVVDDNRDAAETLAQVVEALGHEVDVAFDGPTAIAKVRALQPDAVLCDIGLPGMDGYAVARELRSGGPNGLRLFALSGYARPEDVAKAREAGFDEHLAKPADPRELERVLALPTQDGPSDASR